MKNFIQRISQQWQIIFYLTLIFASLSFLVSTLIPPKYRSDIEILIIQNNTDVFSASKGVSYLSDVFVEVAHTETFFADVQTAPFEIDKKFSEDPKKRKNQWEKELKISKVDDTGILRVSVFDTSRGEAEKIAGSIGWNFLQNGSKYYGETKNVVVKIIDGPITTSTPAYPNVFLSAALGGLAGFFASLVIIFFYQQFDMLGSVRDRSSKEMIKDQIKKQLKERKSKKELNYSEPLSGFYNFSKYTKKDSKKEQKQQLEVQKVEKVVEKEISEKKPEGSEKKAEKQAAAEEKLESKTETLVEQSATQEDRIASSSRDGFLSKLYRKSIFSDKKFAEREGEIVEEDRVHQKKLDDFASGFEEAESVHKIIPGKKEHEKESELRLWNPGGGKAPAPENLPIFMEDKEESQKPPATKKVLEEKIIDEDSPSDIFLPEEDQKQNVQKDEASSELSSELVSARKEIFQQKENSSGSRQAKQSETKVDFEKEPSEEDVKERLNKLLKGEF